ncbi:MAG: lysophospholipid acyltransferase family protein [Candidatus Rokubacteria bacterium]|nr:lysophospholipid acyltransferase family protein [Candidatus Rokubacteria bacterium]
MAPAPLAEPAVPPLPERAPRWHAHGWNRAAVYRWGAPALGALPRPARLALARGLAALAPFRAERAAVAANLARIRPAASAAERAALVGRVFAHFAMCFADLISTNRSEARPERLLAGVEGRGHLDAALAGGRGAIFLTAHLGNWELAGRLLALGLARPTWVLVAEEADPAVERFLRGGAGPVSFVTRRQPAAVVTLLAALRRGELVALQGDRALGTRGDAAAPFFGAPAAFPLGPFVLARAAGAPLVPAFCVLGPDRRYTIRMLPALRVGAEGEAAALGAWVEILEAAVRENPEQWFNFFDVWNGALGN